MSHDMFNFIHLISTKIIEAHNHMHGKCIYHGQYRCLTIIHGQSSVIFYIFDNSLKKRTHINHVYNTTDYVNKDLYELVSLCTTVSIECHNHNKQEAVDKFNTFLKLFTTKKTHSRCELM